MVVGTADRNLVVFNLQNPQIHHTFATAGSDGAFNFWDKDSKQRLKAMSRCGQPIPCSTFNNDGSIFAYLVCYDWSNGAENHNPATAKTYIYLHLPQVVDNQEDSRHQGNKNNENCKVRDPLISMIK
ncbi:hypothetical protein CICLE_v10027544mg [Citrus x clementina]|uniref:Anaphase-promoting complex subunit 4 WD40 domain-containing protein n=1 Tax=Citrus clementina TaxID=85681 RepID=V4SUG8_CITCL|nr:hypothetical protein CICLE_v10027544mg [Citrus x clementina]